MVNTTGMSFVINSSTPPVYGELKSALYAFLLCVRVCVSGRENEMEYYVYNSLQHFMLNVLIFPFQISNPLPDTMHLIFWKNQTHPMRYIATYSYGNYSCSPPHHQRVNRLYHVGLAWTCNILYAFMTTYHLYSSVFITNKTPSGMIKHHKSTEPEKSQKGLFIFLFIFLFLQMRQSKIA